MKKSCRACKDCIHEYACQAWNVSSINDMNADHCTNYEIVKDSNAYFLGVKSAEDDAYSRGCLAGIELGKSEALCGITAKDAKSMMCTLDSLRRLVFAVHGLIDIVDDRNISKMREILNQLN